MKLKPHVSSRTVMPVRLLIIGHCTAWRVKREKITTILAPKEGASFILSARPKIAAAAILTSDFNS